MAESDRADRDRWLRSTDRELLVECRVDFLSAGGPGGQKRNKTSSAVRLRHGPTGLIAVAQESRSQAENKARALKRLRHAIALRVRQAPDRVGRLFLDQFRSAAGRLEISPRHQDYFSFIAVLLDEIFAARGHLSEAAQRLRLSTAQLSRLVLRDEKALDAVNSLRRAEGLRLISGSG